MASHKKLLSVLLLAVLAAVLCAASANSQEPAEEPAAEIEDAVVEVVEEPVAERRDLPKFSNRPDGWGVIKWGEPAERLGPVVPIYADPGKSQITAFERRADRLLIAGIELAGIKYYFIANRLVSVSLEGKSASDYEGFVEYFTDRLGDPLLADSNISANFWMDSAVTVTVLREGERAIVTIDNDELLAAPPPDSNVPVSFDLRYLVPGRVPGN